MSTNALKVRTSIIEKLLDERIPLCAKRNDQFKHFHGERGNQSIGVHAIVYVIIPMVLKETVLVSALMRACHHMKLSLQESIRQRSHENFPFTQLVKTFFMSCAVCYGRSLLIDITNAESI